MSDELSQLLSPFAPKVRRLAMDLRSLVRDVEPEAAEEIDLSTKLIGFTFIPGSSRGDGEEGTLHQVPRQRTPV